MKRRSLLTHAAVGSASAAVLSACREATSKTPTDAANLTQPSIRWRMATSWPKSLDIVFGAVETVCQRVSEMTSGRFSITPYEAGEIVPGLEVLDAVSRGTVECGHTASYYYVEKNPALAFGTTIPFGLNAQQQSAWLYHGGGLDTMQKLYAAFGVINFPAGSTGAQMGGWFTRKINTPADLKGLKMRIPGLGGNVMSRLGATVKVLSGDKIFDALEAGEIDAAEWVGPYEDEKLGLNRIAPFYYYPGWWEPGTTYEVQVNLTEWNQLPNEYRQVFQAAVAEANLQMLARYDAANGEALQRLLLQGIELFAYSPEILQLAHKTTFELYEETAKQDASFQQVYQQWRSFRDRVYQWNRVNELSFAEFSFPNSQ